MGREKRDEWGVWAEWAAWAGNWWAEYQSPGSYLVTCSALYSGREEPDMERKAGGAGEEGEADSVEAVVFSGGEVAESESSLS